MYQIRINQSCQVDRQDGSERHGVRGPGIEFTHAIHLVAYQMDLVLLTEAKDRFQHLYWETSPCIQIVMAQPSVISIGRYSEEEGRRKTMRSKLKINKALELTDRIVRIHEQNSPNPLAPFLGLLQRDFVLVDNGAGKGLLEIRVGIDDIDTGLEAVVELESAVHGTTDEDAVPGLGQRDAQHTPQSGRVACNEDILGIHGHDGMEVPLQMSDQRGQQAWCRCRLGAVADRVFCECNLDMIDISIRCPDGNRR